jgi:hypothetical protein
MMPANGRLSKCSGKSILIAVVNSNISGFSNGNGLEKMDGQIRNLKLEIRSPKDTIELH